MLLSLLLSLLSVHNLYLTQSPLTRLTVLIDPGHGGVDGGTQDYTGVMEKEINLAVALKVRDHLRQNGLNVLMTRETDTDLSPFIPGRTGRHRRDLLARVEKARKAGSIFLVSIHCDWSTEEERRGAVVFYNYLSPVGKELAQAIQAELNTVQKRPQKTAPGKYFIIRQRGIEGVLVEAGFLSNHEEADLLRTPEYQEELARAIARGVLRYCGNYLPSRAPGG